jgi:hypothetical protein
MLKSDKYRFIFVHIYKTGGSSITSALMPFCTTLPKKVLNKILKPLGVMYFEPRPYPKHAFASDIISKMGQRRYKSYFSFAFVRNPWDLQVSLYKYVLRDPTNQHHEIIKGFSDFSEYIEWRCNEEVQYQKDFIYSQNGEKLVNYIGKFETLNRDFQYICERIGISANLPHLNVSQRKPYQEYYNVKTARLVQEVFKPDIEIFNYRFEE